MASRKKTRTATRHHSSRQYLGITALLGLAGVALGLGVYWIGGWNRSGPGVGSTSSDSPRFDTWQEPEKAVFGRYAGSSSCRECHPEAYSAWARSNHGLAERPLKPDWDRPAFDPPQTVAHGTQTSEARLSNGVYQVVTLGRNGRREPYDIARVIGNDPLRQFLVTAPGGRFQTLEMSYDPQRGEWFDVYGNEDRQPGEWGHWTGRGMTWNSMCASCHNTRLRKNYDEGTDAYHTTMAEMSVGCEACHGPMEDHVTWRRQHPHPAREEPGYDRYKFSRAQFLDVCGGCHSRRYQLTEEFQPGDSYFDHFALTLVDGTNLYYPDGQVREEDYEFASFLSSRMHAAGVTCLDCHHPHLAKTLLPGNLLCLRCHNGKYPNSPVIDPARHTFHKLDGPGGQCVNCHMPQTTYMQRHHRHDHGFTIPDPLLTKTLGIPNACNRCHGDKDAEWALAAVEKWYGPKMDRPTRSRAQWIAAARRGEAKARDPLLAILGGKETPYWKAVAANLLDIWAAEPAVTHALVENLSQTNPMVRLNAVHSLSPLVESRRAPEVRDAVRRLLDDPVRSVRYEAAWALRPEAEANSRAGRDLEHALDLNADQPSGQMQKGVYELSRQNLESSLAHYEKAVAMDPNSAPLRHELGVVLSMLGRNREALEQMQQACRLAPREAEFQYKLGLAWNEVGEWEPALQALEEAVRLNPRHVRAWYNLGLARQRAGMTELALEALAQAEKIEPNDPSIPYARATILAQAGRPGEAKVAAARALEIQPGFAEADRLLRTLP
jgi:tetratricopeptide (TPR) repeat protein